MGKYAIGVIFILSVAGFAACDNGSLCQEAQDILDGCMVMDTNTMDGMQSDFLDSLISDSSCEGSAQCVSQCIVENPDGACEFQVNHSQEDSGMVDEAEDHEEKSPALESFDHCWLGCFLEDGLFNPTTGF